MSVELDSAADGVSIGLLCVHHAHASQSSVQVLLTPRRAHVTAAVTVVARASTKVRGSADDDYLLGRVYREGDTYVVVGGRTRRRGRRAISRGLCLDSRGSDDHCSAWSLLPQCAKGLHECVCEIARE